MKRPEHHFESFPLNLDQQKSLIYYGNKLQEYANHLEENVKGQVEGLLLITRLLDNNSNQLPETFRTELSELIKEMALSYKTLLK